MMIYKEIYQKLLNKAVQYLAQRNHSSLELKQKLAAFYSKNFYDHSINDSDNKQQMDVLLEKIIAECELKHWLDDAQYVEQYIAMRSNKGYGKTRIIMELKQRGIDRELISTIVEQQSIDWLAIGAKAINKKFSPINPLDFKQKVKIYQFLSYRGFTPEEDNSIYQLVCSVDN